MAVASTLSMLPFSVIGRRIAPNPKREVLKPSVFHVRVSIDCSFVRYLIQHSIKPEKNGYMMGGFLVSRGF
jgi:hypothetical protein